MSNSGPTKIPAFQATEKNLLNTKPPSEMKLGKKKPKPKSVRESRKTPQKRKPPA
jgi:hypothetical protein